VVLRRQFRNCPLSVDRFKRDLGLELGVKPPACLHAGSSFPAEDPSYALFSQTGTTSGRFLLGTGRKRLLYLFAQRDLL
jgi:hypothetical protein